MRICIFAARRGFSLIELLVVIAIFAILATLAVSAFSNIGKAGRLTKAGGDVSSLLEQARTHAMANNIPVWVGFHPEDNALAVAVVTSKDGSTNLASTNLVQLGRVRQLESIGLGVAPSGARPGVDPGGQLASRSNSILSFSTTSGGLARSFNAYVLRFNNRGEAQLDPDTRNRVIEIGLLPRTGTATNTNNYAVIQVGGLTGSVKLYRP